jgi:hypothetical protein
MRGRTGAPVLPLITFSNLLRLVTGQLYDHANIGCSRWNVCIPMGIVLVYSHLQAVESPIAFRMPDGKHLVWLVDHIYAANPPSASIFGVPRIAGEGARNGKGTATRRKWVTFKIAIRIPAGIAGGKYIDELPAGYEGFSIWQGTQFPKTAPTGV